MENLNTPIIAKATRKRKVSMMLMGSVGGYFGINRRRVAEALAGTNEADEVNVVMASPGGNVWEGISISNLIKSHPATTNCYLIGECASAATVIASGFDNVIALDTAIYMIHNSSTYGGGNKRDMEKAARVLSIHDEAIINAYKRREKMTLTRAQLRKMMDEETWMNANQAKKYGFVDQVVSEVEEMDFDSEIKESDLYDFFALGKERVAAFSGSIKNFQSKKFKG